MKIAVIVPTKNRSALLKKCLSSLARQNYPRSKYEIIVVDDGSDTNETERAAAGFRKKYKNITYVKQGQKGPAAARNRGIKNTSAEIVAFTDDDCVAGGGWLKAMDDVFTRNSDVWAVEGRTVTKGKIGPFTHCIVNKKGGMFVTCNMAFRKSALKLVGGFDERFHKANREDSDAAFSIMERGGRIVFEKNAVVVHANLTRSFINSLKRKAYYTWDVLLMKKHPGLYKKFIKYPFERFTFAYIIFWILALLSPYALAGLPLTALAELLYRKYSFGLTDFIKFLVVQSVGSFIVVLSALYGLVKFRSAR